ncbi:hypothetical protein DFJ77DRAFT_233634 [Powellomyces hirtus]|nr:hypothetical protein DFJ77DRAFT_233634 [Powellomyces hirtus]
MGFRHRLIMRALLNPQARARPPLCPATCTYFCRSNSTAKPPSNPSPIAANGPGIPPASVRGGTLRSMRAALEAGSFQDVVQTFIKAYQRKQAPVEAYTIVLTACAHAGDVETASRIMQLCLQRGIALPTEAHMMLLHAIAQVARDPTKLLIKHLTFLQPLIDDSDAGFRVDTSLFVARTLLVEGGQERAQTALSVIDGIAEEDLAEYPERKSIRRNLRILALGSLEILADLQSTLAAENDSGTIHHFACVLTALSRCRERTPTVESYEQIISAMQNLSKSLGEQSSVAPIDDLDVDLSVVAIKAAFQSCKQEISVAGAIAIRNQFRAVMPHTETSHLTGVQRAKIVGALDNAFLRVMRDTLRDPSSLNSNQRREFHNTWTWTASDLQHRKCLRDAETCHLVLELHILEAATEENLSSIEAAAALFEDMKRDGLVPTPEIYHLLMSGWATSAAQDRFDKVLETVKAMQRAGHVLSSASYAHIFTACVPTATLSDPDSARDQQNEAAERLFAYEAQMAQSGLVHSSESMSAIILALFRVEHFEDATQRFTDMRLAGLPRSLDLYNSIFAVSASMPSAAIFALRDLRFTMLREHPETGIRPNANTFRLLLRCCETVGDVPNALQLFKQLREVVRVTKDDFAVVLRLVDSAGGLLEDEQIRLRNLYKMDLFDKVPS